MRVCLSVAILTVLAGLPAPAADKPADLDPGIYNAHWIWLKGIEEAENATVYFRKTFSLTGPPKAATLEATADNEYQLWLNGKPVGSTSAKGEEAWRVADRFDVAAFLRRGENMIAVRAVNHTGKAAFIASLAIDPGDGRIIRVRTDGSWQAALNPGEQWEKDSSAQGDWQPCLDYGRAETTGPWFAPRRPSQLTALIERSKRPLERRMVSPVSVKIESETNGAVTDFQPSGVKAGRMQIKPTQPGARVVVTCDFGEEIVGYPSIIGYTYGPVKITLACGEYEAECLNPFQAVLTGEAPMGALRWAAPERRAFRYARFTIEPTRFVRIERIQAQAVGRRIDEAGTFECSDQTLNKIYEVSARTLRLCMQDFYEDGPKRDRLLWIGDFRVEALVNYYLFGDVGLARRCLMQMADLQLHDGMIPGVGPDPSSTYLPDYCAYYVIALADYYRHTGDLATLKPLYPYLRKLMSWFRANTDENGLFVRADRPGWWIFVDWDDTMEKKDRVTAMEALYYWALNDAAEIARAIGAKRDAEDYLARAAKLKQSANALLWSEDKRAYVDCLTDDGPSEKVHRQPNALALLAGLAEQRMIPEIAAVLTRTSRARPVTTPYMNFYVACALFEAGRPAAALELIRTYWGGMIDRGATTFWEKFDPEWPTPYEQPDLSYCHGWSSGPGALLCTYVAGVRPGRPGFEQAVISPNLAGLAWVKAGVPTRRGTIRVDWKNDRGCAVGSVTLPIGCSGKLVLPPAPAGTAYALDDKAVKPVQEGDRLVFTLKGGRAYVVSLLPTAGR